MSHIQHLNLYILGPELFGTSFVENGVLSFQAGHPFLYYRMEKMAVEYDPSNYISLAESLLDFCDLEELGVSVDENTVGTFLCRNDSFIRLEQYDAFYALDNKER